MTQIKRNKTTIFEKPESKPVKKVYNRSPNCGDPVPKALLENNIGSLLRDQYHPKPLTDRAGEENVRDVSADRPKKRINKDRLSSGVVHGLDFAQMDPKRELKPSTRQNRVPKEVQVQRAVQNSFLKTLM